MSENEASSNLEQPGMDEIGIRAVRRPWNKEAPFQTQRNCAVYGHRIRVSSLGSTTERGRHLERCGPVAPRRSDPVEAKVASPLQGALDRLPGQGPRPRPSSNASIASAVLFLVDNPAWPQSPMETLWHTEGSRRAAPASYGVTSPIPTSLETGMANLRHTSHAPRSQAISRRPERLRATSSDDKRKDGNRDGSMGGIRRSDDNLRRVRASTPVRIHKRRASRQRTLRQAAGTALRPPERQNPRAQASMQ